MRDLIEKLYKQWGDPRLDLEEVGRLRLLDRYIADAVIGIGGTAVVISALDTILNRPVAIKVWNPHTGKYAWGTDAKWDQAAAEFFQREARLLARLRHPNLCEIYDFGVSDGIPWLVLELLRGQSLRKRIQHWSSGADHGLDVVLRILKQIASAAAFLHEMGLCQLDIKPENILVDGALVKLVDFASALERPGAELDIQRARIGTPGYLAPEILDVSLASSQAQTSLTSEWPPNVRSVKVETASVTAAADVFSMGIVAYELCCVNNPLADGALRKAAYEALHIKEVEVFFDYMTAAFLPDLNGELKAWAQTYTKTIAGVDFHSGMRAASLPMPTDLVNLIGRMVAVKPAERPQNAGDVFSALSDMETKMFAAGRVFISHSHADKRRFADALARALSNRGITVWYDSWDLSVGEPFWDRIGTAVRDAEYVVLVISENSLKSTGVSEELRIARIENIARVKVLPILIDSVPHTTLPPDLQARQVLSFPLPTAKVSFDKAVDKLVSDMKRLAKPR